MALPPFPMGPARQPDSGTDNPPIQNGTANTADLIYKGSLLVRTSGVLRLVTANPTAGTVVGVAASAVNTAPGYNMANQPTVVSWGDAGRIPYYPASTDTLYASHFVNGSDTYVAAAVTDIGVSYGLRTLATGEVAVDKSLTTTNGRVIVRDIDNNAGTGNTGLGSIVYWNFLSTTISQ